jgi:hypothetical protein
VEVEHTQCKLAVYSVSLDLLVLSFMECKVIKGTQELNRGSVRICTFICLQFRVSPGEAGTFRPRDGDIDYEYEFVKLGRKMAAPP